jgi:hypothetical protein
MAPEYEREYRFCRRVQIDHFRSLLVETTGLFRTDFPSRFLVDLSHVDSIDTFGVAYIAACFHSIIMNTPAAKRWIRRPRNDEVHKRLLDFGFYEEIGAGQHFQARTPSSDRVDLTYITQMEIFFVDDLLDLLERMQPFKEGLKPTMRAALYELVGNFAEHSGSAAGAWISGDFDRELHRITLCVLDLGRGIPATLRTLRRYHRYSDAHLIELATERGVSSVRGTRGIGLDTIRRFVKKNGGSLTIVAGNGAVTFDADARPKKQRPKVGFPGTAVALSLVPTRAGLYVL